MKLPTSGLSCATRSLSALATAPRLPPPAVSQRLLHRAPFAQLPRCRTFSTSNALLQQDCSEPPTSTPTSTPTTTPTQQSKEGKKTSESNGAIGKGNDKSGGGPSQAKKRSVAKNSLHRVAIVAEKGNPSRAGPGDAGGVAGVPAAGSDSSATIKAVCVANAFDMEAVVAILSNHGFAIDPDGTGFDADDVVHARGMNQGDIFVFPSGTVVTWSLAPDVIEQLATVTLLPAAESPAVADKEAEDLDFELDPAADKTQVRSNGVVVLGTRLGDPRDITLNKIAISSGLARSTKMAMLEKGMEAYLESTRHIPDRLSRGANLSRRLIWQKTGELLALRSQLNHYNELTDALPDMLWDGESRLETYYKQIGRALNMGYRIEALNNKLTYAREVVQAAQEVITIMERESSERHGTRLEWIIIILIAIEVAFALRHLYYENDDEARILDELRRIRGLVEAAKTYEKES